ncbi:periplasmic protein TonB, partial [Paramagnetospirillum caucaseum]
MLIALAAVWAVPARAEDPIVHTQPLKTELFEDIVDGIGDVLGVLVGPPISSPSAHLNIPGAVPAEPRPESAAPAAVAAPPPPEPVPTMAVPAAAPVPLPPPVAPPAV